jgi:hypothetical protein
MARNVPQLSKGALRIADWVFAHER